jgi:photosynthetic reaction center cytochrome c subunit
VKSRYAVQFTAMTFGTVLAAAVVVGAQGGGGQQPQAPPKPGQLAPDYFKNIKVLKNVPAEQLRTQMQYFAASLGVQCNFCHVQGQFDSDDNPRKDRARKMMAMVDRFNENAANDITVTCATCHHGHVPPERTPTLAVNMTQAEADAAAAARAARGGGPGGGGGQGGGQGRGPGGGAPGAGPGGPGGGQRGGAPQQPPKPTETVDDAVNKYVQAVGGQSALNAAKTRVAEGTQTTRDLQSAPIKVQEKVTGEYRIDVSGAPNPSYRVSTPSGAFGSGFGNNPAPRDLEGVDAAQVARPTEFGLAANLKSKYSSLTVRRYENVDGKQALVVDGRRSDIIGESLYFDRESGLLVRRVIRTKTAYGDLVEQVDYSDFRDAGGIKTPFQVKHSTWSQVTTEKFTDVKVNAPVDDALFAKK